MIKIDFRPDGVVISFAPNTILDAHTSNDLGLTAKYQDLVVEISNSKGAAVRPADIRQTLIKALHAQDFLSEVEVI